MVVLNLGPKNTGKCQKNINSDDEDEDAFDSKKTKRT